MFHTLLSYSKPNLTWPCKYPTVIPTLLYCCHHVPVLRSGSPRHTILVDSFQNQAKSMLYHYVISAYPRQPFRFGQLIHLLSTLQAVSPSTIEDLFFKRVIGAIPMANVLSDMYYKGTFLRPEYLPCTWVLHKPCEQPAWIFNLQGKLLWFKFVKIWTQEILLILGVQKNGRKKFVLEVLKPIWCFYTPLFSAIRQTCYIHVLHNYIILNLLYSAHFCTLYGVVQFVWKIRCVDYL